MSYKKYKSKPFDCWEKAKELRALHIKDLYEAKEKGKLIVFGNVEHMMALPAGLGDYGWFYPPSYDIALLSYPERCLQCLEALEDKGYRDTCVYLAMPIGSLLINSGPLGGAVMPDICLTVQVCEPMVKVAQIIVEELGIPNFVVDCPQVPPDRLTDSHRKYLVNQLHDAIEWMEKVTGRKYDDEKLIEAVYNEWETTVLWANIYDLNKAIPAPMDAKTMGAFMSMAAGERHKKRAVEFYRILLDEMRDRVQNQIAGVPTERCRLLHEAGSPPWYHMRLFRIAEKYGAVILGGMVFCEFTAAFSLTEDGHRIPAQGLKERGIELKTRDDALTALADLNLAHLVGGRTFSLGTRVEEQIKAFQDWHADAAIFHFDRGCPGMGAGMLEARLALKELGVPTLVYESNSLDRRQFAEAQVTDLWESFFESMGLTKLED